MAWVGFPADGFAWTGPLANLSGTRPFPPPNAGFRPTRGSTILHSTTAATTSASPEFVSGDSSWSTCRSTSLAAWGRPRVGPFRRACLVGRPKRSRPAADQREFPRRKVDSGSDGGQSAEEHGSKAGNPVAAVVVARAAGSTTSPWLVGRRRVRSRGTSQELRAAQGPQGSSPLARGARAPLPARTGDPGLIPARAGSTLIDLRVCRPTSQISFTFDRSEAEITNTADQHPVPHTHHLVTRPQQPPSYRSVTAP